MMSTQFGYMKCVFKKLSSPICKGITITEKSHSFIVNILNYSSKNSNERFPSMVFISKQRRLSWRKWHFQSNIEVGWKSIFLSCVVIHHLMNGNEFLFIWCDMLYSSAIFRFLVTSSHETPFRKALKGWITVHRTA